MIWNLKKREKLLKSTVADALNLMKKWEITYFYAFQPFAVCGCVPCSPLNRRNQYTLADLYMHEYSPELRMFFSGTLSSYSSGAPAVSGMLRLNICFRKGSVQVNMLPLSFAGIFSLHVMRSSSPLIAAITVLSRCIPARVHNMSKWRKRVWLLWVSFFSYYDGPNEVCLLGASSCEWIEGR